MSYLKLKLNLKLQVLGHLVVKFHSNLITFLAYKQMMLAEHHVCVCDTLKEHQTTTSSIPNMSKQTWCSLRSIERVRVVFHIVVKLPETCCFLEERKNKYKMWNTRNSWCAVKYLMFTFITENSRMIEISCMETWAALFTGKLHPGG